jgi:hypothetical protein
MNATRISRRRRLRRRRLRRDFKRTFFLSRLRSELWFCACFITKTEVLFFLEAFSSLLR